MVMVPHTRDQTQGSDPACLSLLGTGSRFKKYYTHLITTLSFLKLFSSFSEVRVPIHETLYPRGIVCRSDEEVGKWGTLQGQIRPFQADSGKLKLKNSNIIALLIILEKPTCMVEASNMWKIN